MCKSKTIVKRITVTDPPSEVLRANRIILRFIWINFHKYLPHFFPQIPITLTIITYHWSMIVQIIFIELWVGT